MRYKFVLLALSVALTGSAQGHLDKVLSTIEQNNTTLKALRQENTAQQWSNKSGIFLPDPEVGYNHLWGAPTDVGNRQDISFKQNFAFPTVYTLKYAIARRQNSLLDHQYQSERIALLLEAKGYCLDLIYTNALHREWTLRVEQARSMANVYEERLAKGEGNLLERNKALMNLTLAKGELARASVERERLHSELRRLNGGIPIALEQKEYDLITLPDNFPDWLARSEEKSPLLRYALDQEQLTRKGVDLAKSSWAPNFSAGYMSERVVGQIYQGVSVGISIPLWENKNKVRQARSAAQAAVERKVDLQVQFRTQLETLYRKAIGLQQTAAEYRRSLEHFNNTTLLRQALEAGEISLLDYMVELGFFYEAVTQSLAAERDFQKAYAELTAVEWAE